MKGRKIGKFSLAITDDQMAWVKAEAKRRSVPVAFVIRGLIEREMDVQFSERMERLEKQVAQILRRTAHIGRNRVREEAGE